MLAMSQLAKPAPALICAGITLFWLLLKQRQQHKLIIQHLLAVPLLPLLLMLLPARSLQLFSPATILALSLYGFLLIALMRDIPVRWHMRGYAAAMSLLILIMFARLYFAQLSLIQLFAELSLSSVWVSALGIAYRRHAQQVTPEKQHYKLLLTLVFVLFFYPLLSPSPTIKPSQFEQATKLMEKPLWQQSGWQTLESYRHDLREQDHFPMNLQWAGSLIQIQQQLSQQGWQLANNKATQYFNWLKTDSPLDQLPILAHVHKGDYETLTMVKYLKIEERVLVIRLWPTAIQLTYEKDKATPLWIGSISYLQAVNHFWIRYLQTGQEFNLHAQLSEQQKNYQIEVKYREQKKQNWNGEVTLLF